MGRSPCCDKIGLKKGPWTPEEDQKLLAYIEEHGHGSWRALPNKAGLQRCGKSCRLRWTNYLRPDIKRGKFSLQEEQTIIQLHALLGNRWSAIATHLPKRTDNEIKNYWNTHLKKRLSKMGIDPVTHKPKSDSLSSASGRSKIAANLNHTAQWENARLEAEARLALESKLRSAGSTSPSSVKELTSTISPSSWHGVWSKPLNPNIYKGGYAVDLESPTSTLSFSDTMIPSAMSGKTEPESFRPTFGSFKSSSSLLKYSVGEFAAGFTGMLLGKLANERIPSEGCEDSENAEGGSCVEMEEGDEDENKNYWNGILNLVNSSSPPNSPPPDF